MEKEYRYELKFTYPKDEYYSIINAVKTNPYLFREIFRMRKVCNIYLDTPGFKNYNDNLAGVKDRTKLRIRWYDDDTSRPVLEYKHKNDKLGWKDIYILPGFDINHFSWNEYLSEIEKECSEYPHIINDLRQQIPALNNTYERVYFSSWDDKYRITIDTELKYRKINEKGVSHFFVNDNIIVVEVKFAKCDFEGISNITSFLNSYLTANSKYATGIYEVYNI